MLVVVALPLSEAVRTRVEEAIRAIGGQPLFESDFAAIQGSPKVIFGHPPIDYVVNQEQLAWVQTASAGVDWILHQPVPFPKKVKLTNGSGVYGPAGGDHVLAMMLYFSRGLYFYQRMKERGEWVRDLSYAKRLKGQTVCIVGLGDLGRNVAQRARAFGMKVVGVKRSPGPVEGVDEVTTPDDIDRLLPTTDHLVITLPLTRETEGLISRERIQRLPRGAFLYNIGRGAVVDEEALVDALRSGHLGGAGLDVFVEEPLPAEHPFWSMENVVLTPHIGADTPWDNDFAAEIFIDNLKRFHAGEPLRNEVDLRAGY